MKDETYNIWVTPNYYLRSKMSIEQMQPDLKLCSSPPAYTLIKKANITQNLLGPAEKILDIGCGWGRETLRYKHGIGLDLTLPYLKTAKHYSKNEYILASADQLPFKTDSFQGVIMTEVIEHLEHPEQTLTEVKRVLKSKGQLIIQTPNRNLTRFRPIDQKFRHIFEFNGEELKEFLREQGFKILEKTGSTIPYFPSDSRFFKWNFNWLFFKLWKFLNWLLPFKWDIIVLAEV